MAVPIKAEDVGWYKFGPSPGEQGDAVMDGHLDWWTGPAVFWNLGKLKTGDEIWVARADGSRLLFVVDGTSTVPSDSRPAGLFATGGPPTLSLITCSGSWDRQRQTYTTRLVVHASLATPRPTQTPGDGG
jgi:sortase (surface protein transpeptidase)